MMLTRIDMAGPEKNGKKRESNCDNESCINEEYGFARRVQQRGLRRTDKDAKTGRNRFKLEGYIRGCPHHGNDCHQTAQLRLLAIARCNEVGNGRDAMNLAYPDNLDPDNRPEHEDKRRPKINRQKIEAPRRR